TQAKGRNVRRGLEGTVNRHFLVCEEHFDRNVAEVVQTRAEVADEVLTKLAMEAGDAGTRRAAQGDHALNLVASLRAKWLAGLRVIRWLLLRCELLGRQRLPIVGPVIAAKLGGDRPHGY